MWLQYPHLYVLMSMNQRKATALNKAGTRCFSGGTTGKDIYYCHHEWKTNIELKTQLSNTPVSDYHVKAQTIEYWMIDIGTPPSGSSDFPAQLSLKAGAMAWLARAWGSLNFQAEP